MREQPTLKYNGLTVVLSNPSRHDLKNKELLSGSAGHFFQQKCLGEHTSKTSCDIRTSDTIGDGLIEGTKGLLLLGDRAFQEWTNGNYKDYTLSEQRGTPLRTEFKNIITTCSFFPQDCLDIQDWESKFNPQNKEASIYESEDEEEDESDIKKKGATRRKNWRFWLERDCKKILGCLGSVRRSSEAFYKRIIPSSEEALSFLSSITSNDLLYLDIETSVDGCLNMYCVAVATDSSPVVVIPIFKWDCHLFYSPLVTASIFKGLSTAMSKATVVTWNGYGFDLLVLAWRYHIPWGIKHYDGMIAHHRIFPEVEKSLGHGMSLWTWEEYHKDQGCFFPKGMDDYLRLLNYNAKDVHAMRLIKPAIEKYAAKIPGLTESISQGMDTIYPYTLCSLTGIPFDEVKRAAIIHENDKYMMQLLRFLDILKGDYKERLLPTSTKSCVRYFHEYLNYAVVGRSRRISKKTGRPLNTPSLSGKNLYKLKLLYPKNIIIDICIKYRERKKESGLLGFTPWDINQLPA